MESKQQVWYVEGFQKGFDASARSGCTGFDDKLEAPDYKLSSVTISELLVIVGSTQAWPRDDYP